MKHLNGTNHGFCRVKVFPRSRPYSSGEHHVHLLKVSFFSALCALIVFLSQIPITNKWFGHLYGATAGNVYQGNLPEVALVVTVPVNYKFAANAPSQSTDVFVEKHTTDRGGLQT